MIAMSTSLAINTTAQYICNLCDCVSIGSKGDYTVRQIFDKFPHANCYSERISTKKSVPGTIQLKGDGKNHQYVINMFVQFYPGVPKFPNDNISKRIEWFSQCLEHLLADFGHIQRSSLPTNLGAHGVEKLPTHYQEHREHYLSLVSSFIKKYSVKYQIKIKIVDYQDQEINLTPPTTPPNYSAPVQPLQLTDLDSLETSQVDEKKSHTPQKIFKVIKHIDITHLIYVDQPHIEPEQTTCQSTDPIPQSISTDQPIDNIAPSTDQPSNPILQSTTTDTISQPTTIDPIPQSTSIDQPNETIHPSTSIDQPQTQPKPKIDIKVKIKPVTNSSPTEPSQPLNEPPIKVYDKNLTWNKTLTALFQEIPPSWNYFINNPELHRLLKDIDSAFVKEMEGFGDFIEILPIPQKLIFNAFHMCQCPPKVVIVGQDCYAEKINEPWAYLFLYQMRLRYHLV